MKWAIKDDERIAASPNAIALCPVCKQEVISKCGIIKEWHWSHKSVQDCDNWSEPESEWHLKWKNYFPKENQEVIIDNHRADIKNKDGLIIELQNSLISPDNIYDREEFYKNMIWLLNGKTLAKNIEIRKKSCYFTFIWKSPPKSWFHSNKNIYIDMENKLKEIEETIYDCYERINLIFKKLTNLIGKNPNDYFKQKNTYSWYEELEEDKRIEAISTYKEWIELSKQINNLEKERDIFNSNTIFLIKKLYKNIPCSGWGYLISKKDFLNEIGGINYG